MIFLWVVLGKNYKNFGNFVDMMRPSGFQIVFGPVLLLPNSFQMMIFLQLVVQEKEYMNQNWWMNILEIMDKKVENLTRVGRSPWTLWRVKIILKIVVIRLRIWVILSWIIPTRHIWLVHVVHIRVGVIRIKWGQGEKWIHVRIERIVAVEIYITIYKKKENKQTNK